MVATATATKRSASATTPLRLDDIPVFVSAKSAAHTANTRFNDVEAQSAQLEKDLRSSDPLVAIPAMERARQVSFDRLRAEKAKEAADVALRDARAAAIPLVKASRIDQVRDANAAVIADIKRVIKTSWTHRAEVRRAAVSAGIPAGDLGGNEPFSLFEMFVDVIDVAEERLRREGAL